MNTSAVTTAAPRRSLSREDFERLSPVVRRQAMWFARRAPAHVTVNDLAAKGWAGALDALVSVATMTDGSEPEIYLLHRIRSAMYDHLLSLDNAAKRVRGSSRQIARTMGLLERMHERSATSEEIAVALSISEADYENQLLAIADNGLARIEVLDFDENAAIRPQISGEERATLERAIELLPESGKQIMALVYQEDCSMAEAGAVLGMNERGATCLHAETIHRLRASLGRE